MGESKNQSNRPEMTHQKLKGKDSGRNCGPREESSPQKPINPRSPDSSPIEEHWTQVRRARLGVGGGSCEILAKD